MSNVCEICLYLISHIRLYKNRAKVYKIIMTINLKEWPEKYRFVVRISGLLTPTLNGILLIKRNYLTKNIL